MAIDFVRIPEPLLKALKARNVVLLIGAGISRHASEKFPAWANFVEDLIALARDLESLSEDEESHLKKMIAQQKYPEVAQYLRNCFPSGFFDRYIEKRFASQDIRPAAIHRALVKLRLPLIMTTNYDLLLETAYAEVLDHVPEVATPDQCHKVLGLLKDYGGADHSLIFKMHGTALRPEEIVLGEQDYNRLLYVNHAYHTTLRIIFMTKFVLMVGYSFTDPDVTGTLSQVRTEFPRMGPDYIVLPRGSRHMIEARQLRQAFGVEVIEYEPSPDRSELFELIEFLASFSS